MVSIFFPNKNDAVGKNDVMLVLHCRSCRLVAGEKVKMGMRFPVSLINTSRTKKAIRDGVKMLEARLPQGVELVVRLLI